MKIIFSISFLFFLTDTCVAFMSSNPYRKSLIKNDAPLVTADEILKLNRDLKDIRNNKKGLLLFDYSMKNVSTEHMKSIYSHVQEKTEQHSFLKEMQIISVLSFQYGGHSPPNTLFYNIDVQHINLLRAFESGAYKKQEVKEMKEFPKTSMDISVEKVNRIVKNKYHLDKKEYKENQLCYFSPNILYGKSLKRKDSLTSLYFDCSRHFYLIDDYLLTKQVEYLNSICNPVAIRITGKVYYRRILQHLTKLNKEKEIILVLGFTKMISARRMLPLILKHIAEEDKHKYRVNFVFQINSYQKRNVTQTDIDHDLSFIYRMKSKYNIQNLNFYMKYHIEDDEQIRIL